MSIERAGMHAFIVSAAWMKWVATRDNSFKNFLAEVGTPSIVAFTGSLASSCNGVPGFYIKIPDGWSVKFSPGLQVDETVSDIMLKVSEIKI